MGRMMLFLFPLSLLLLSQQTTALPAYFFPIASDAVTFVTPNNGKSDSFSLSPPFKYAGVTASTAYVNRNGFVSFYNIPPGQANPSNQTSNKDIFAPMWTQVISNTGTTTYKQSTSGAAITLATSTINSMYPEYPNFVATWTLVVTWNAVVLATDNKPATFQAVLISDGTHYFILFHYDAVSITQPWMPGFGTSQTAFTLLPLTNFVDSTLITSTSNVGVAGRWSFEVENNIKVYHSQKNSLIRIMNQHPVLTDANGNSAKINFQQSLPYFGRNFSSVYINKNGFLSFSEITDPTPRNNTGTDIIAPLWYPFSTPTRNIFYEEISSGSALQSISQLISPYYPSINFTATWAFLVVFDLVSYQSVSGNATFEIILTADNDGNSFSASLYGNITGLVPAYTIGLETLNNTYNTYKSAPQTSVIYLKAQVTDQCSTGSIICGTNEVCGKQNSVFGCYCDPSKPKPKPEIYDAVETCGDNGGTLSVSRCQLLEAGVLESSVHLYNSSCKGELMDNRLVFTFNNNDKICGGTYQINITHLIYYNGLSNVSGIISNNALYLAISCDYPLIQKISTPKSFLIVGSIILKNIAAAEGSYQVLMEAYPNNTFITPYSGLVTFTMNQEMFISVSVDGFDSTKISTVLDSCWATPSNNINDTVRWNLITNECPDPMESSVTILQNGLTTSSRFSFNMFTFNGFADSIYLHCQVHLCLVVGNNCAPSCSGKRRRRRAEDFHDTAAITMSF